MEQEVGCSGLSCKHPTINRDRRIGNDYRDHLWWDHFNLNTFRDITLFLKR